MLVVCLILAALSLGTCEPKTAAPPKTHAVLACDASGHCHAWTVRP